MTEVGIWYQFDIYRDDFMLTNVCSKDKSIVELFLKQHGFPEPSKYQIKEKYQEDDKAPTYELKPYIFKSNMNEEVLTIFTTEEIFELILEQTTDDLITDAIFPMMILYWEHFPIIRCINDLIYRMRYIFVQNYIEDYEGMDEMDIDYILKYIKVFDGMNTDGYSKQPSDQGYNSYEDFIQYPTESLLTASKMALINEEPQPITIDSYVYSFIKTFGGRRT